MSSILPKVGYTVIMLPQWLGPYQVAQARHLLGITFFFTHKLIAQYETTM